MATQPSESRSQPRPVLGYAGRSPAKRMSPRERLIAIAAGAVLGLAVLDQLLLSPLLDRMHAADERITDATLELERAAKLFKNRNSAERQWKRMAGSSLAADASTAESQLLNRVRDWGQTAGLAINSLKPERVVKEKGFDRITVRATGVGAMSQVSRFLYLLHTADIPVRVSEVQLSARKEGTDDLSLQIGISTIYASPASFLPAGEPRESSR